MANSEKPPVTAEDIESLIEIFKHSGWDEMHLEAAGLELFLSNDPAATGPRVAASAPKVVLSTPAATVTEASSGTSLPASKAPPRDPIPDGLSAIRAPNLGTFYRAPKPGAAPYVAIGQQIETTTEVCLIEVMKLFTPVQGGIRGIVREIRANDGQMVEFDQPLIIVEPN